MGDVDARHVAKPHGMAFGADALAQGLPDSPRQVLLRLLLRLLGRSLPTCRLAWSHPSRATRCGHVLHQASAHFREISRVDP
jgi:hypothetical protein